MSFLFVKKESLLNVYLMHWTFIPPKIQTNLYTSTKMGGYFNITDRQIANISYFPLKSIDYK